MRKPVAILLALHFALCLGAQAPGGGATERLDTLSASVFTGESASGVLSRGRNIRTEVISSAGLRKMACCTLADSFENSASVSVGYSDAVTGARQIRLLGQSGIYVQMLDENRPVMRGLAAPWGLNYIPAQWLESIQIAKGVTSVINGVESMTGQINVEHRKPTDEIPLFLQASVMSDTRADLNLASAHQLDRDGKWSTILLAHASGNFMDMDNNGDGFLDDPRGGMVTLSNRWLYYAPSGVQLRFGVHGLYDRKSGGQVSGSNPWQSDVANTDGGAYAKLGIPLDADNTRNIAAVLDYSYHGIGARFGANPYSAEQNSAFFNLLYQDHRSDVHHLTLGLGGTADFLDQSVVRSLQDWYHMEADGSVRHVNAGAFAEYTFTPGDSFSAIAALRGDWFLGRGFFVSPRLTLRWAPWESLVLRGNGGRGLRLSLPLTDNIGVLSTGKIFEGAFAGDCLEDAWTFGGNATWYLPWDGTGKTYVSFDYFGTRFTSQMFVDYTADRIYFYGMPDGAYSRTDSFQLDFSSEPFRGFTVNLTGRLTDARQSLLHQSSDVKPMTSRYKAVLNLQYATRLRKWIFDFTASLNGPCKVWDFMAADYEGGYTPAYPLLYAQVTRRFKGFEVYLGGENLTGATQRAPIIGADAPWNMNFDASCIWGPIMGAMVYAGLRLTIWKKYDTI